MAKSELRTGLVLGKFMPPHRGHEALIRFALEHCDRLIVLVCAYAHEPIPGPLRLDWVKKSFASDASIDVEYCDEALPNAPFSSREVSKAWADYLVQRFPQLTHIFTSESYGDYVAEYAGITHMAFNPERNLVPVSATLIRQSPFRYWKEILTPARPYFVKKVAIVGAESTGKSTLAEQLAAQYKTVFVPEQARDLVPDSKTCTWEDLLKIGTAHAAAIEDELKVANRLLFLDTEINTTKAYGQYLFGRTPEFSAHIEHLNYADLYLLLDTDVPYVQDGTRLDETDRNAMQAAHLAQLQSADITPVIITGSWEERFRAACAAIHSRFADI